MELSREQELIKLYRARESIDGIAKRMGMTYQRVVKECARLSEEKRLNLRGRGNWKIPASSISKIAKSRRANHKDDECFLEKGTVSLIDLKPNQCHFPLDGGYCGCDTVTGKMSKDYCEKHYNIMWRTSNVRY